MFQHRFSLVPFPLHKEEGQRGKKFEQEEAPADSLVADPPSQATLHPSQASAAGKRLQLLLWNFQPNLGGLLLAGLTPGPATVVYYALFNLPRKLTFGSSLNIKRWIEMIRRAGRECSWPLCKPA